MSKEFQLISDVSPGSSGWTVKVVVAEKFSPRIAQKSPTKYQNLLLMDTELCIPTDEKDFTEIRNIQGVKTVVPRQPVADLARQPPLVAGEPRQPPFRPRPPRVFEDCDLVANKPLLTRNSMLLIKPYCMWRIGVL
ncbi:hypothetical protein Fot_26729 [Forsythia ovata]|uniref:Uncharacterized protein n=1 Tax=Forsythia ovata TaxID=205694 RepID=A0ABD1UCN9_9LAMI